MLSGLGGRIDAVVDAGAAPVGVESTIVDLSGARPRVLRAGGVPLVDLQRVVPEMDGAEADPERPKAPGQLASHYAPRGRVRLNAEGAGPGEVMVGFGAVPGDLNLSERGDLAEAAARLFDILHQLDAMGAAGIAVAPIPDAGLGAAINDRLRRAAAER